MADKDNKMEKSIKEAIGKSLNEFNKKIGMAKIIKNNKNQDRILKGILSQVNDENTEKTEKSNVITLDNSTDGIVELKEIKGDTNVNVSKMEKETPITHVIDDKYGNVVSLDGITEGAINIDDIEGNTMVNCCKDGSKELTLNGDIDTSGYGNVTLTEGVDGGKVDIALEGNTMVNVCDQEDPIAITKNYEVTTGNHIALQGEYDGKCRPNIYGNTLVSWQGSKDINKGQQVTINKQYETKSIHTLHTTVGDKVYFRIKFTVDEMNTTSAEPKIFTGYSMGYKINVKAFKDCTVGKIEEASTIREHESARTDQTHMDLCIGMYAPMPDDVPAGSAVCKYTMHDYVIYNLTQLFGAGKEPAQEWCDKNLPYLEGMQSSFEDKLITDEKDAHNGKYKVDYKVTGKNKFNGVWNKVANSKQHKSSYIKVNPNSEYILSVSNNYNDVEAEKRFNVNLYDKDKKYINFLITGYLPNNVKINTSSNCEYIQIITRVNNDFAGEYTNIEECNVQIEEGTKTTTYEPYKEYTKTLYLNTPLLEGDTIEQSGNDIVHVHRYGKVVLDGSNYSISRGGTYDSTKYRWVLYKNDNILKNTNNANILINDRYPLSTPIGTWGSDNNYIEGITINSQDTTILLYLDKYKDGSDDSKTSLTTELQQNPLTVVYKLQTPTKEVISTNDNLLLDSYVNGHLDVDSIVPIDKVAFQSYGTSLKYLSPNTEYTIQFESDSNGKLDALALNSSDVIGNLNIVKGINKFNITTSDKITINYLWTTGIGFNASKIVVTPKVDGDFGYFKEMKSVGQNDTDGHKIEILSKNKNLLKNTSLSTKNEWVTFNGSIVEGVHNNKAIYATYVSTPQNYYDILQQVLHDKSKGIKKISGNKWYTLSFYAKGNGFVTTHIYPTVIDTSTKGIIDGVETNVLGDGHCNWDLTDEWVRHTYTFKTNSDMSTYGNVLFRLMPPSNGVENVAYISCPMIQEGKVATEFFNDDFNKKEILMNEPLRGLPNGVRDKYVMIDGKWYIERNCRAVQFKDLKYSRQDTYLKDEYPDIMGLRLLDTGITAPMLCDRFAYSNNRVISAGQLITNKEGINIVGNEFFITIQKAKLKTLDFKGIMNYFTENPTEIIAKATTPTYEPIEYNPFEVYSDTTHISNNSNIPCNIVIKNTGYNCILKPSTLYTIALDTNKSGTIGMNLGGAKGTTSNNVATITTPETLTDNTLRLYGKGIKSSKVRLLEGDKTNWIPSHFEGMKSCFEDKLQEDGKYKMEILSRNSDESLSNKIQFLLNEPLRAVGDIKDKVYVKEDKIIVQRNCGSVTFDGSDTWNLNKIENNIYTYSIRSTKFLTKMKVGTWETLMNNKCYIIDKCGTATTSTPKNEQLLIHNTVEDKFIWYSTPLFSTVQSVKQYLNDNPFKILYQLETPVYEEIEYSNNRLTLDSYNNSTLFYDSNIPVSNTSFKPLWEELVYVKNSTTYYIQFNAIGNGDVVVNLGGTELSATITEGYNKIEITTPNESTNLLTIDGQGIKISKVVVSEALCSGYYKGLQSCFEEHMENGKYICVIRGISLDGNKVNGIKFYLNEPLRGIGNIKDRLCIKDNKLMVERNCGSVTFDGSSDEGWLPTGYGGHATRNTFEVNLLNINGYKGIVSSISNLFSYERSTTIPVNDNAFRVYTNAQNYTYFLFTPSTSIIPYRDTNKWKEYLQQNPITIVYQLQTPTYEEITNEYGLPIILEGYENGIVYVDSAITPTTSIKYTSNNTVPTTLSSVDNLNTTTQDDINNNIVTYMMDIDMMLTEMEMEDNASTMSLSDSDDNNQKHNTSHNNILDRMNKEDRIKYQDNTTKMLEKVIKGKSLTNEENINRIDLYLSEGKIREEQSNYLKELLKEGE